jgi:hypothetical protein
MLQILLLLAVCIAVLTLPVMFAARMVGAKNTGFGSALMAIILQSFLFPFAGMLISNQWGILAVAVIVGSAIYSSILGTTFPKGFLIGLIASMITIGVSFLLDGLWNMA